MNLRLAGLTGESMGAQNNPRDWGVIMRVLKFVIVGALALAGCGAPFDRRVEPADVVGEAWPLTIEAFDVNCTNGLDVFIVDDGGTGYQIRGGERSGREAFGRPVRDLMEIRKLDPSFQVISPGVRLSFEATRREALSRCVEAGLAGFTEY